MLREDLVHNRGLTHLNKVEFRVLWRPLRFLHTKLACHVPYAYYGYYTTDGIWSSGKIFHKYCIWRGSMGICAPANEYSWGQLLMLREQLVRNHGLNLSEQSWVQGFGKAMRFIHAKLAFGISLCHTQIMAIVGGLCSKVFQKYCMWSGSIGINTQAKTYL